MFCERTIYGGHKWRCLCGVVVGGAGTSLWEEGHIMWCGTPLGERGQAGGPLRVEAGSTTDEAGSTTEEAGRLSLDGGGGSGWVVVGVLLLVGVHRQVLCRK